MTKMIRERILDQVISSLENSAHDQGLSMIDWSVPVERENFSRSLTWLRFEVFTITCPCVSLKHLWTMIIRNLWQRKAFLINYFIIPWANPQYGGFRNITSTSLTKILWLKNHGGCLCNRCCNLINTPNYAGFDINHKVEIDKKRILELEF